MRLLSVLPWFSFSVTVEDTIYFKYKFFFLNFNTPRVEIIIYLSVEGVTDVPVTHRVGAGKITGNGLEFYGLNLKLFFKT